MEALVTGGEKKHSLKLENYVLCSEHTKDFSQGDSLSDCSERLP